MVHAKAESRLFWCLEEIHKDIRKKWYKMSLSCVMIWKRYLQFLDELWELASSSLGTAKSIVFPELNLSWPLVSADMFASYTVMLKWRQSPSPTDVTGSVSSEGRLIALANVTFTRLDSMSISDKLGSGKWHKALPQQMLWSGWLENRAYILLTSPLYPINFTCIKVWGVLRWGKSLGLLRPCHSEWQWH